MFEKVKNYEDINLVKSNPKFLENFFGGKKDLMPFWVADMDFEVAPEIKKALTNRVDKGIFAYEMDNSVLIKSAAKWFEKRHDWVIERGTLRTSPSILSSIGVFIQLLTEEGDGIIYQTPGFQQFRQVISDNNRKIIQNPLKLIDGKYEMDFIDLEEKMKQSKILILCSPHNPIGRVWNKEELIQVSELAVKYDVFVISDEIHSDIILGENKFIPYGSLDKELSENSVSLFSPAKTFNIPSLSGSFVYAKNREVQKKYDAFMKKLSLSNVPILSRTAMTSAYNEGKKWLDELLVYLNDNIEFISNYFTTNIPQIKIIPSEATSLIWLDFRELGLNKKELESLLIDAGLALNPGYWYGKEGIGFARMSIGTSREYINEALDKLKDTINSSNIN